MIEWFMEGRNDGVGKILGWIRDGYSMGGAYNEIIDWD